MRDLDRIREVSEYRVTGPQLASLLGLVGLLAGAAFLAGYQTGLWRGPLDSEMLLPTAEEDTRQAGEALAGLLARRDAPSVESMAMPILTTTPADAPTDPEAEVSLVSTAYASSAAIDPSVGLVASDDTKPNLPEPEETPAAAEPTPAAAEPTPEPEPEPVDVEPVEPAPVAAEPDPASATSIDALAAVGPPAGRGYTVQVAAYEEASEALALIHMLRGSGIEAFHQSADVQGKVWHRVRVGVHSSKAAAEQSASRLEGSVPYPPYVTSQP